MKQIAHTRLYTHPFLERPRLNLHYGRYVIYGIMAGWCLCHSQIDNR